MNTRHTTLATVVGLLTAGLTGCTSNGDPATITSATTTTTKTSPTASATPSTSLDPAAKEAQDRQDAEIVWRKFNGLIRTIASLSPDQVEPAITEVAVDPQSSRLRDGYAKLKAQHQAGYGQDISYISWPQPIDGKNTAVLNDCQDGSQAGFLDTQTGNKLTVGTPNTPVRGTLQRTPAGWRVVNAEVLEAGTCTPGQWNA